MPPDPLRTTANTARRFQLATSLTFGRARTRAIAREGQALFDLLWRLGFRPSGGEPESPPAPSSVQRVAAM